MHYNNPSNQISTYFWIIFSKTNYISLFALINNHLTNNTINSLRTLRIMTCKIICSIEWLGSKRNTTIYTLNSLLFVRSYWKISIIIKNFDPFFTCFSFFPWDSNFWLSHHHSHYLHFQNVLVIIVSFLFLFYITNKTIWDQWNISWYEYINRFVNVNFKPI